MSEEQNEVLELQRYLLERRMYRLDPAPPKLSAHRLPLFKSGIYRTVLMIISARRKAVLSP